MFSPVKGKRGNDDGKTEEGENTDSTPKTSRFGIGFTAIKNLVANALTPSKSMEETITSPQPKKARKTPEEEKKVSAGSAFIASSPVKPTKKASSNKSFRNLTKDFEGTNADTKNQPVLENKDSKKDSRSSLENSEQNLNSSTDSIKNPNSKSKPHSPHKQAPQRTLYDALFSPRHMLNTLLGVATGASTTAPPTIPTSTAQTKLRSSLTSSSQSTDSESEPDFYYYSYKHNEMYHHPPHSSAAHPVPHSLKSSTNQLSTSPTNSQPSTPITPNTPPTNNNNNNNVSISTTVMNNNNMQPIEPDTSLRDQELNLAPSVPCSRETPSPRASPKKIQGLRTDETLGEGSSPEGSPSAPEISQEISEDVEEDPEALEAEEFNPFLFIARLPPPLPDHTLVKKLPTKIPGTSKYTLVLDLDETLVHCSTEMLPGHDLVFPVVFNEIEYQVYVRKRPQFREFLEKVSALFEVVVFTASQEVYASKLLNLLDPEKKYIKYQLYRDSCVNVGDNYLKDLRVLGRNLAHVMIIDNSPQAFGYQLDNGIPIETWFEDTTDRELINLVPFLEQLVRQNVDDVRHYVREKFKLHEKVNQYKNLEQQTNLWF